MAHEIKIPAVGESITSATIGTWHKADGEYVHSGDVILTIETDKITTELEADKDGVLKHVASAGDEIEIGGVVATIEEGEAPAESGESQQRPAESEPESQPAESESSSGGSEPQESGEASQGTEEEIKATPVARKVAEEKGIDLNEVTGTGTGGKITKADVFDAAKDGDSSSEPKLSVVRQETPDKPDEEKAKQATSRSTRRKMSTLRKKIANHLLTAQRESAILTTFNECDMSKVMELRKRVQEDFVARHDVKLGFMSFFIKAVVDGLKAVPSINAQIDGDEIVEHHFYDVGVAVGTEKGLIVPVIRDCDSKSFADIEKSIVDYAQAARSGKVQLSDLQGGVFTITNGGIYGSLLSTPILNPPQSGILGMHSIQQRPIAVDGQVVIRPMMYLALSYDHRLVDGKEAVTFLVRVKECIENPERMLLGV